MTVQVTPRTFPQSRQEPRIDGPKEMAAVGSDHTKSRGIAELSPQHRLNRLELEHDYLAEQNGHLNKELSLARHTIAALRTITLQKEESLQTTQQELDRAYFRISMLSMMLTRQEQQLLKQQHGEEGSGPVQPAIVSRHRQHHIESLLLHRQQNQCATQNAGDSNNEREAPQKQLTPPESPRRLHEFEIQCGRTSSL